MHSDGVILEILPDLVDAGVNVFWVRSAAQSAGRSAAASGRKGVLPDPDRRAVHIRNGTPEQVRQHARNLIAALGSFNGGVIGCHEVASDQPWENVVAMIETLNAEAPIPSASIGTTRNRKPVR